MAKPEKPAGTAPMTAADRARNYRERKAAEARAAQQAAIAVGSDARDERDANVTEPTHFTIVNSVQKAVAAMKWIQPSDGALVDMALLYAVQIDQTLARDPEATGKAASLGQLLIRILHELGGTPTVRLQHELRSLRAQLGAPTPGDEDGSKDQQRATGTDEARSKDNVTSISRPPKRRR
jgi:hypothetical protein